MVLPIRACSWEGQISPREIEGVSKFVFAMKGKNVPGREPQGEKEQAQPVAQETEAK